MMPSAANIAWALIVICGAYLVGFTAWAVASVVRARKLRLAYEQGHGPNPRFAGVTYGISPGADALADVRALQGHPSHAQSTVDRVLFPECP